MPYFIDEKLGLRRDRQLRGRDKNTVMTSHSYDRVSWERHNGSKRSQTLLKGK